MNKILIVFLLFFTNLCFSGDWIDKAKQITIKHELTSIGVSCIDFEKTTRDDGKIILITTFEIHSEACSGDPKTRPKLYFIEFNINENVIKSNAKSDVGQMEIIERLR
jgi:hypothetical protein